MPSNTHFAAAHLHAPAGAGSTGTRPSSCGRRPLSSDSEPHLPRDPAAPGEGVRAQLGSAGPGERLRRPERPFVRPRRDLFGGAPSAFTATIVHSLSCTGKWSAWQDDQRRLADFADLEQALLAWRHKDVRSYQVVAGLTSLGSRRGADDDDAALAAVAMLDDGVLKVAWLLGDLCEVDDVRCAVWEEVKAAEPSTGPRTARYLLQRARQRLSRPGAGMVSRLNTTSLELQIEAANQPSTIAIRSNCLNNWLDHPLATPEAEDPVADLADLLAWARGTGVVDTDEVDLIVELLAAENAGTPREEAQRLVGERRGLAMRTIRRRHSATTARLREAAATYLAETA